MKKCSKYTPETLSRFVDKALPPEAQTSLSRHLSTCPACQETIKSYQNIDNQFIQHIQRHSRRVNNTALAQELLVKIRKEKKRKPPDFSFSQTMINFMKEKKIYLQIASFSAIVLISSLFLQGPKVTFNSPSAIVNLIDGDMASVMILETPKQHHTIIWFEESLYERTCN